ncbi:MAG: hypothetical protein OEW60_01870, partial [Thiovulaceae bacterium]|nr:hypothetical protein [Sulfurimonadaceae bacterium]
QYFNKDGYFERTMDNLRTGTMVQGLETKAIIHAIYLNRVDAKLYSDGEYFFIGTYIENDFQDKDKRGLYNKAFTLKLNNEIALVAEELSEDHILRKSMPLVSRWNRYYRVKFKQIKGNKLVMTFDHTRFGRITLNFQRDYE